MRFSKLFYQRGVTFKNVADISSEIGCRVARIMKTNIELFREIIERSQEEKRGLTVYFNGQTLTGIVKQIIEDEAVELISQQYRLAIVRLDKIEAMSLD